MLYHVYSDSHGAKFHLYNKRLDVDRFMVYGNAGLTAHGIGRDKANFLLQMLQQLRRGDNILFNLGEVDCRAHFYYHHRESGRPINELMEETAERYISMILRIIDQGYRVVVLDVLPAVRIGNVHGLQYYATREERAAIILQFNKVLRKHCKRAGLPFIRSHYLLADENGFLRDEYAADQAHANIEAAAVIDGLLR